MIEWKKTRKIGTVAIGTKPVGSGVVTWIIKKSKGGMSYHLFLGEETNTPTYTRSTINDCKVLAEAYL